MKKAILTVGLFSLMMILTSFTSPEIGGGPGNQGAPRPEPTGKEIGGPGNQGAPRSFRNSDIGGGPGNQGAPRPEPTGKEIGGPGNQGAPRP